jgi:hypothetical protein
MLSRSVVPDLPDDPEARVNWAMRYKDRFPTTWGRQGGFVKKVVAVRWAISHLDLF